jgi:hypothetical protein
MLWPESQQFTPHDLNHPSNEYLWIDCLATHIAYIMADIFCRMRASGGTRVKRRDAQELGTIVSSIRISKSLSSVPG